MALTELARFVPHLDWRGDNRPDLRLQPSDVDNHHGERAQTSGHLSGHASGNFSGHFTGAFRHGPGYLFDLPPGATFEPDPNTSAMGFEKLDKL